MEVIHRGWFCEGPAPSSWIQGATEANLEGRRRGGGAQRLGYPDAQRLGYPPTRSAPYIYCVHTWSIVYIHSLQCTYMSIMYIHGL